MRIGRWSEPRVVFVCQFEEVIREADANETSGEVGEALLGSRVGVSQLRMPKLVPLIVFSMLAPKSVLSQGKSSMVHDIDVKHICTHPKNIQFKSLLAIGLIPSPPSSTYSPSFRGMHE